MKNKKQASSNLHLKADYMRQRVERKAFVERLKAFARLTHEFIAKLLGLSESVIAKQK
jgi:hypothetical protein